MQEAKVGVVQLIKVSQNLKKTYLFHGLLGLRVEVDKTVQTIYFFFIYLLIFFVYDLLFFLSRCGSVKSVSKSISYFLN